jgi:hypothetical protein
VKNKETGTMVRAKDTADTAHNFKSAWNAYVNKTLVAVIAGASYLSP